jgi:hypothetical protein
MKSYCMYGILEVSGLAFEMVNSLEMASSQRNACLSRLACACVLTEKIQIPYNSVVNVSIFMIQRNYHSYPGHVKIPYYKMVNDRQLGLLKLSRPHRLSFPRR